MGKNAKKQNGETKNNFPRNNLRRRFIINPNFQLKMIAHAILLGALIITILYCANLYFFSELNANGILLNLPKDHVYFQLIREQQALMTRIFIATAIGVNSIIIAWGMVMSNRIAGPIYRLCTHINSVVNGNTDQDVAFRKKDFFPELAEGFNRIMSIIRNESQIQDTHRFKKEGTNQ